MSGSVIVAEELNRFAHKIPTSGSIITHECMLTHHNDVCEDGLFWCFKENVCLSLQMLKLYVKQKRGTIFLRIRRGVKDAKATLVAVNVEGGFPWHHANLIYKESINVVVFRDTDTKLSEFRLNAHLGPVSYSRLNELAVAMQNGFKLRFPSCLTEEVEEYPDKLVQSKEFDFNVDNPKCLNKLCKGLTSKSLWINLGDGYTGCGGENHNHSRMHYEATNCQHPLVVRVGSISSTGQGDVYSYDHDKLMIDSNLLEHLKVLNIDVSKLVHDGQSILKLEMKWNEEMLNPGRSALPPPGCELNLIHGPGCTGLANPHNMCYLHSVVQMLRAGCHHFNKFNASNLLQQYNRANKDNPAMDVLTQTNKLITDLSSGAYSQVPGASISAGMFKIAIGHDHPRFCSDKPQAVLDYFLHLVDTLELAGSRQIRDSFGFDLNCRTESADGQQKQNITERVFCIDMDLANVDCQAGQGQTRPVVTMDQFIDKYFEDQAISSALDPVTQTRFNGTRRWRILNAPEYLIVNVGIKKFPNDPKKDEKIDVKLQIDDILDLSKFMYHDDAVAGEEEDVAVVSSSEPPQSSNAKQEQIADGAEQIDKIALDKAGGNVEDALKWQKENRMSLKRINRVIESAREASDTTQQKMNSFVYRIEAMIDFVGESTSLGHAVSYVRKRPDQLSCGSSSTSSTLKTRWIQIDDEIVSEIVSESPCQVPPIVLPQTCLYRLVIDQTCASKPE